ncbi:MAG: GNAT family N-acetyltransferase [Arenimonas sp.]|nr:GNAT family N-acetyltransferase [Arenimonas sp.]
MSPRATVRRFGGALPGPWLDDVARLRIAVFRDWPYLYDGDLAYEREYLSAYAASADSVFVLAFDGQRVVGAATGLPLADDTDEFQRPWRDAGRAVDEVFYFGESVLLPAYRGQGIGHAFFDEREAHARALGRFARTAFCAVDRDDGDPRRPAGHRGNEAFWTRRGYVRQPGLTVRLAWHELGEAAPSEKPLTFWARPITP